MATFNGRNGLTFASGYTNTHNEPRRICTDFQTPSMASPRPLEGKLCIVTGASRGIGAAIAHNLASKGSHILLNYTSASSTAPTNTLSQTLQSKHNIKAVPVQADIGSSDAATSILAAAKQNFPAPLTIHIIVNNAGVTGNAPLGAITPADFHRQYTVNVQGPLLLVQACIPHLPQDRSGRIVNVSSVSSAVGYPTQSVYGGTKAALESMTRTWSRELAERCTVNAINPGPVDTDMYNSTDENFARINSAFIRNAPLSQVSVERDGKEAFARDDPRGGRAARVDEIAGVVGMLCAPEGGWCTGSVVNANGGMKFCY